MRLAIVVIGVITSAAQAAEPAKPEIHTDGHYELQIYRDPARNCETRVMRQAGGFIEAILPGCPAMAQNEAKPKPKVKAKAKPKG